jgi:GxxExxY protein
MQPPEKFVNHSCEANTQVKNSCDVAVRNIKKVRKDLIYPELSYKIVGILFEVWKDIGYSHREKYIQNAIARCLTKNNIPFRQEIKVDLKFQNDKIGIYFLDFLIDNKIILEIKRREYFSKNDIDQLYAYLKATGLKLGIIAHFTKNGVKAKRIVNIR